MNEIFAAIVDGIKQAFVDAYRILTFWRLLRKAATPPAAPREE